MIKNLKKIFVAIIFFVLTFIIISLYKENLKLKKNLCPLVTGEKIKYFELLGPEKHSFLDISALDNNISLIFIFSRPCSTCNYNFRLWNIMAKILKKYDINIYGIIVGEAHKMESLNRKEYLNFNIYIPKHSNAFVKKFRFTLNQAQTILVKNKLVKLIKCGNLSAEDYKQFIQKSKALVLKHTRGR